jgi:serine/threonine protein phosphatase PrpC
MRFSIFQDTALGARASNQDRMGYCFTRDCLLMLVADGMGGHLRGEVAAQLSLQTAAVLFEHEARPRLEDPAVFLEHALLAGHEELERYRAIHHLAESPHTTIVACVVQDNLAWWAHAGDSRLYVMRNGELVARTRDHSKVEALVRAGYITPEQAVTHPERNKVLNCLGSLAEPVIEIESAFALQAGDTILLCSDGFWSGVDESEMARACGEEPLKDVVPRLIREALKNQGALADNTTALALQWKAPFGDDLAAPSSGAKSDGVIGTTIETGPGPASDVQHRGYPSEG